MAFNTDTIAAIATPLGRGGIGILRLSGPQARIFGQRLIRGPMPKPRSASYRDFLDAGGMTLDQGIILYFQAPNSFTGEDVIEFQGHGSPPVLNALLASALEKGARLARPGEFSERAFINNRLDLTQAEAIADLIHASSEKAARAAIGSLQGVFSKKVEAINQRLINLRTIIEGAIDFSEEVIEAPSQSRIEKKMQDLIAALQSLQAEARGGQRLQEGMQLVLLGPPNAGKSSLLNALSNEEVAIVNQAPGTTRDVLRKDLEIDGLAVHIMDTAGLHETNNIIEQEGIRRALDTIKTADQIIWVVDSTLKEAAKAPKEILSLFHQTNIKVPITIIRNKVDLSREPVSIVHDEKYDVIRLSAVTGAGLDELKTYLKQSVGYDSQAIGFSARERHTSALRRVEETLSLGLTVFQAEAGVEILAVHLNEAHQILGEITGVFTTDDLLGHIFSTFCIGK